MGNNKRVRGITIIIIVRRNEQTARSLACFTFPPPLYPSPSFPPPFSAFRRRYNTSPPIRPIRKTKITCAKFWRRSAGRVRRRELGERGGDGERGGGGRDRGREGFREASLSKLRTRYSFLPLRRPFDHGWASGGSSKNVNSTSTEMENKTPPKRKWLGLLTSFHETRLLSLHLRARREGPPKRSSFLL